MNTEIHQTAVLAEALVAENSVPDALGPPTQTTAAPDGEPHRPTESPAVAAQRSAPRSRVGLLRRWSVAELLVGAVSRPPAISAAS